MLRATRAEISLENIKHNIDVMKKGLKPGTKYLAVIKANAYGHGIVEVGRFIEEHGYAEHFAVAIAEEGLALREAGLKLPILILGPTFEQYIGAIIENELTATVFSLDVLESLEKHAARLNKKAHFHFKIDTGMGRIGFRDTAEFEKALALIKKCPHVSFDGMFTHFAISEREDKAYTFKQAARYDEFYALAVKHGFHPLAHVCNSAATLELPELQHDMVRGGISMYGYNSIGHELKQFDLKPALTFKTCISHIKEIEPGESVSYGRRFIAEKPTRIATLPVGYGDGYMRIMSTKAQALVSGKRVPQVGSICMDQCMLDVTDVPEAQVGDEVVLLGRQGDEEITADEVASWAGTISYEVLLAISARVPRVYR